MMKNLTIALVLFFSARVLAQDINLPEPQKTGGKPLMEALNERHSTRDFTEQKLSEQQLSNLLWAAWGFNREEKRTAPSSMNRQEMQVYVAMESGLYLYDAKTNVLLQKSKEDLRGDTGKQGFVKGAALNLIYVANYADNNKIDEEKWAHYSYVNTGFMAQNVYLYCASEGLGTVIRAWMNVEKLKELMALPAENKIVLAQTVGYPKE